MGEGVNDPKGIFGTTLDLSKKYGHHRVIESPISENGITGISIGLSLTGFKVLLVHQRVEFALLSIEQIFNNAAKSLYVTNGKHNIPIVIRIIIESAYGTLCNLHKLHGKYPKKYSMIRADPKIKMLKANKI